MTGEREFALSEVRRITDSMAQKVRRLFVKSPLSHVLVTFAHLKGATGLPFVRVSSDSDTEDVIEALREALSTVETTEPDDIDPPRVVN